MQTTNPAGDIKLIIPLSDGTLIFCVLSDDSFCHLMKKLSLPLFTVVMLEFLDLWHY